MAGTVHFLRNYIVSCIKLQNCTEVLSNAYLYVHTQNTVEVVELWVMVIDPRIPFALVDDLDCWCIFISKQTGFFSPLTHQRLTFSEAVLNYHFLSWSQCSVQKAHLFFFFSFFNRKKMSKWENVLLITVSLQTFYFLVWALQNQ